MPVNTFKAGDRVVSVAVGRKEGFIGEVLYIHPGTGNRDGGDSWIVRCPRGHHWHRNIDELSIYIPPELDGTKDAS